MTPTPPTRPLPRVPHRPARRAAAVGLVVLVSATGAGTAMASGTLAPREVGAGPVVGYRLPVADAPVLRAFEAPPEPWAAGHRGVDLAVGAGAVVAAPADGVVTFAGPVAGRGVVTVHHDDGLLSSLEPLAPSVAVGDRVRQGQALGTLAAGDHCGGSSCLHWGVRVAPDRYLDPLTLVAPQGPVVLLPPP